MRKTKQKAIQKRAAKIQKRAMPQPLSLSEQVERVLITGDLTELLPEQRVQYYNTVCKSLGLNPFTRPFAYILYKNKDEDDNDKGKLQLYALKSCTDQLRKIHHVTVAATKRWEDDGMLYAEAVVADRTGRRDSAIGAIPLKQYSRMKREFYTLTGRMLANAKMHVETKAKRRATLSLCGLAFLDETELDTVDVIGGVTPEGRVYRYPQLTEETGSHEAAQAVAATKIAEFAEKRKTAPESPKAESSTAQANARPAPKEPVKPTQSDIWPKKQREPGAEG